MGILNRIGLVFARKWIGGTTIGEAVAESRRLNAKGEKVIINYLGEELKDMAKININARTYLSLLQKMKSCGVKGSIAVKPTQLGLNLRYKIFLQNYAKIVKKAKTLGIFVWMDMEDYQFVDDSIRAYMTVVKSGSAGICIQAKLKRSMSDLRRLVPNGAIIRLVKGAYSTREGITFTSKHEIDNDYLECMDYLFQNCRSFMIATHDDKMSGRAMDMQRKYKKRIMFGMLKGIRPNLAAQIAGDGNDLYIYVPFGEDWIYYSTRRLMEKEHSMLVLRSIFQD